MRLYHLTLASAVSAIEREGLRAHLSDSGYGIYATRHLVAATAMVMFLQADDERAWAIVTLDISDDTPMERDDDARMAGFAAVRLLTDLIAPSAIVSVEVYGPSRSPIDKF